MKPWVIFNAAISLDGRIGKPGKEIELFNKLDHDRVQNLRGKVNAIMLSYDALPKIEKLKSSGEEPKIVIVDPDARLSSKEEIFSQKKIIIATSSSASKLKIAQFKKKAKVITAGEYTVNLRELLKRLYHTGIRRILLEDTGDLSRRMFEEALINEIYLLINPLLLGEGIDLLAGLKKIKKEKKLSLQGITQYGDKVLLHYLVK